MGKYSALRGKLPELPVEESRKVRLQEERKKLLGTEDFDGANTAYLSRLYADARKQKDELEDRVSVVQLTLDTLEEMIVERLQEDGQQSLKLADGTSLFLNDDVRPSVKDRDAVVQWLKDSGQEALLTVMPQTLKGLVRTMLEKGEDIMPGVEVFLKTGVRFMKAKNS